MIEFEWDLNKAKTNLQKHHVAFGEVATIFSNRLSITIGVSTSGRFLMVAHMDRDDRTRIISSRELTRKERKEYEKEIQRRNR